MKKFKVFAVITAFIFFMNEPFFVFASQPRRCEKRLQYEGGEDADAQEGKEENAAGKGGEEGQKETDAVQNPSGSEKFDGTKAISPWDYQSLLGKGLDVTWAEFRKQTKLYSEQMVVAFQEAGVSHVRIRVKDPVSETLFEILDEQIADCLKHGLIPVLAYQAHAFKANPTKGNMDAVTAWWRAVSEHYRDASYLLSFDLMIESSDALNKQPQVLNQLYEQTVSAIRDANPERIIIISPRLRSDPFYLHELEIPSRHNGYLMAEWHFYASGPDKSNEKKKWTTGTEEEKALIMKKIEAALAWQEETGIPTWVGAWMPGNYNKGNSYSVEEQVIFATYMVSALTTAKIPFAVNADRKYYDAATNMWIKDMQPVVDAIFSVKE